MARYRARLTRPDPMAEMVDNDVSAAQPEEAAPTLPSRDDAPTLERLVKAEIVACEPIPQGSNYSFVVGLSDAGKDIDLLGVYKPRRGEAPLWDFPSGTLYKREYAAYLTSVAMGWPFVPPTVIRDGPYGVGSVQLFVQPAKNRSYFDWRKAHAAELMRIAAFDYLTNNADRKAAHCILDEDDQVWGIDHGLTFNADPKLRTVLRDFSGTPLPNWLAQELQRFADCEQELERLLRELRRLLDVTETAAFLTRLERMQRRQVFPRLDRYDSVPREWW